MKLVYGLEKFLDYHFSVAHWEQPWNIKAIENCMRGFESHDGHPF